MKQSCLVLAFVAVLLLYACAQAQGQQGQQGTPVLDAYSAAFKRNLAEIKKLSPQQHKAYVEKFYAELAEREQEAQVRENAAKEVAQRAQRAENAAKRADDDATLKQRYYAMLNDVRPSHVFIEKEPHDCDWDKAPIGNKECHFDKQVNVHQRDGANDAVYVTWTKVSD